MAGSGGRVPHHPRSSLHDEARQCRHTIETITKFRYTTSLEEIHHGVAHFIIFSAMGEPLSTKARARDGGSTTTHPPWAAGSPLPTGTASVASVAVSPDRSLPLLTSAASGLILRIGLSKKRVSQSRGAPGEPRGGWCWLSTPSLPTLDWSSAVPPPYWEDCSLS